MADLFQDGLITTLHDVGKMRRSEIEKLLQEAVGVRPIGLVLPVTADDMRAPPFEHIIGELEGASYIHRIIVTLGRAPRPEDYRQATDFIGSLGEKAQVLWTDGKRIQGLYHKLTQAGLNLGPMGKGQSVWTAFGYLLSDPRIEAFVLHDCDIVGYDRDMLARLCLPMVHPSLNFEFCKAYYARFTDRMHGRVARLLVTPLIRALISILGNNRLLIYLDSFRYPLAGEFAITSMLARYNRIPSDWGLEIGTLAEVFRNTSIKRVCQVDLCQQYEHKHQPISEDPGQGLRKMATDISITIFRTLASMGLPFPEGFFPTLRSAYLRIAQDSIRQYHADSLFNDLLFDRHSEESAVEGFAQQIIQAGEMFQEDPAGGQAIPNWNRVLAAYPDFPQQLHRAVKADAEEFGTRL